jgi:hypothetical protein
MEDAETVFRTAAGLLTAHLRRLPDGETGARSNWIGWQLPVFAGLPQLELVHLEDTWPPGRPKARVRPGARSEEIHFEVLGYAAAARESYARFASLQRIGVIAEHLRFQVSLPTPIAPIAAFLLPEAQAALEPAYERRLLAELDEILVAIPHDRLAIQWDTAIEFALLEGVMQSGLQCSTASIVERLTRLGRRVPADVELGYHFCYGDAGHRHFVEPRDTALIADVARAVGAGIGRPLTWIHLPVPRGRTDTAYFEPLRDLRLPSETELYLGLIHATDGSAGADRRIAAALSALSEFGVATECGMGRRPPESIPDLLRQHAEIAAPWQ